MKNSNNKSWINIYGRNRKEHHILNMKIALALHMVRDWHLNEWNNNKNWWWEEREKKQQQHTEHEINERKIVYKCCFLFILLASFQMLFNDRAHRRKSHGQYMSIDLVAIIYWYMVLWLIRSISIKKTSRQSTIPLCAMRYVTHVNLPFIMPSLAAAKRCCWFFNQFAAA